jgi:predicted amidohydrolase YtcJ
VLDLCGKLPKTVDGGEIIVDAVGKPTGVFLDNAQLLIPRPAWSIDQMVEFYQRTMADVLGLGLTGIHDAMTTEPVIDLYKRFAPGLRYSRNPLLTTLRIADEGNLPVSRAGNLSPQLSSK